MDKYNYFKCNVDDRPPMMGEFMALGLERADDILKEIHELKEKNDKLKSETIILLTKIDVLNGKMDIFDALYTFKSDIYSMITGRISNEGLRRNIRKALRRYGNKIINSTTKDKE